MKSPVARQDPLRPAYNGGSRGSMRVSRGVAEEAVRKQGDALRLADARRINKGPA